MSGKNSLKFRIERLNGQWNIVDPQNANVRVPIDQALVDVTYVSTDNRAVEGYILSVHGLDFEIAKTLDRPILNQLGVAANLRSLPPPPRRDSGMRRVRLEAAGSVVYESGAGRH
jgi:hypothetical protein